MRFRLLLALGFAGLAGCATYRDDLARGENYYNLTQYNNALSVWRMLERDWDSLDYAEQSRYAFLRGMTDYRMGYRADARHWLAIARAINEKHPGGLDAQGLAQLEQALTPLNAAVYSAGAPKTLNASGTELTNEAPPQMPQATAAPNSAIAQPQSPTRTSVSAAPATPVAPAASAVPLSTVTTAPGPVPPPSQ